MDTIQMWAIVFALISLVCSGFLSLAKKSIQGKRLINDVEGDAVIFLLGIAFFSLVMSYGMIATMLVGN